LSSKFEWRPLGWNNLRAYLSGSVANREHRELLEQYERVKAAYARSPYGQEFAELDFIDALVAEALARAEAMLPDPVALELKEFVYALTREDPVLFLMPELPGELTIENCIALRTVLRAKERFLAEPVRYEDVWREKVIRIIEGFVRYLPPLPGEGQFSVRALDVCNVPEIVNRVMATMYDDDVVAAGQFHFVREQLERNLVVASGMSIEEARRRPSAIVQPCDSPLPPDELVATYLCGTAFERLFALDLPFALPEPLRFEHMHIVAGSGHGKTQTLQHLILADLQAADPPSLVIIDSQGDMIQKISRLALFDEALQEKLIIIDPRDIDHPPALNMFDVNLERIRRYGIADREQILNGVIELYEYFFGSLLGAELTQKQSLVFRYLARLMIYIPAATIRTMIELMDDTTPYRHIIASLPESARMFFDREFADRQYGETRAQIKRRLYGIVENQTFERMFSAPRNQVDVPAALNEGKIILVNTAKDFLKGGSSILGRYFIALTLQAALERAAIPEHLRRPAFLYIDEAAEYFDDNIDDLLNQARKYKLGMILAHQYLDQLAGGLKSSIASNTSIKFAGGVSDRDARAMAPDMRTTPTFILDQRKGAHATQFACYLRNVTSSALSLAVPFGTMERQPTMNDDAYQRLLGANRANVSARGSGNSPRIASGSSAENSVDPVSEPIGQGVPPTEPTTRQHRPEPPRKSEHGPQEPSTDPSPEW
jgi:hypothetical protein